MDVWWAEHQMWVSSMPWRWWKWTTILCGISRSIAGRLRVMAVLLYLALMGLYQGCCTEFWAPQYKTHVGKMWWVQLRATKIIAGWKTDIQKDGLILFPQKRTRITVVRCTKENQNRRQGEDYSLCVWSNTDPSYPERFRNCHPWGDIQDLTGQGPGQPELNWK